MIPNLSDLIRAIQGLRRGGAILALLSDDDRLPDPGDALAHMPAGSLMIVRSRDAARRRQQALALLAFCRARGIALLIANDVRLANEIGADGVHLSEASLKRCPRRPAFLRPDAIVTAAAHDDLAIRRAEVANLDAVLVSPVFPTKSHPGGRTLGPLRFAAMARRTSLPVLALGGIDARSARRLQGSGAAGVAGIGFAQT